MFTTCLIYIIQFQQDSIKGKSSHRAKNKMTTKWQKSASICFLKIHLQLVFHACWLDC